MGVFARIDRSPGGAQVDPPRDGAAAADRSARPLRHLHIRHRRTRVLFRRLPHSLLPRGYS